MEKDTNNAKKNYLPFLSIVFAAILILIALVYAKEPTKKLSINDGAAINGNVDLNKNVLFESEIPEIFWGNIGAQMIESGVIDAEKFKELYSLRGGISDSNAQLLTNDKNNKIKINKDNAGFVLNLLWAFGLGNKSPILENGPMSSYGNINQFASTGGWPLSKGNVMDHYSKHKFVTLTKEQWELVKKVSKNIYRPCCNNATYFPDCNHGMAMLGLLELMASQNMKESQMYNIALRANSLWFPGVYSTIQKYLELTGATSEKINSKQILSREYSSASGYSRIARLVPKDQNGSGAGCGL